ncbi:unnamed protein product [Closterium sp. NIES-53]
MSASLLLDLLRTPHAMYVVVDSSASYSVYSSAVSLGASVAEAPVANVGTCVDTSLGPALEDTLLSFTLDYGASHCFFRDHTTLTPLPAPVFVALADPTSGPVTAHYSTTLPCPAVPSGFMTGFYDPSLSGNLVGVRPLVSSHVGVWIEPSGKTAVSVDGDTYAPLATFTAEPGASLYTLHTGPRGQQQQQPQQHLLPPTPATAPRQVLASLAHPSVLWHHRMGHPSIPCLRAMSSQCLVLGLPRVLPLLPPSLAPPCGPYIEGRLRATPYSSSLRPATEPFETLHLDIWAPPPCPSSEGGARVKDPGGATSGGVGVGAETVPARGPGAGVAGVGAEPVSAGGSTLQGAGVGRAVPGGARTGGASAPSTGPGGSRTGRVAAGGAGSGGGATDVLESGPGC